MRPRDIKAVLDSMVVLVDTREQPSPRAERRYKAIGIPTERCVLDYGDYAYNAKLPNGEWIYDTSTRVRPACVVERKMSLDELAMCLTHDRERFAREYERARAQGAHVWLMVEKADWNSIFLHQYRSQMAPQAMAASIVAFCRRYDSQIFMCSERATGRLIRTILALDLEDRLKAGEFV